MYIGSLPFVNGANTVTAKVAGMSLLNGAIDASKISEFKDYIIRTKKGRL